MTQFIAAKQSAKCDTLILPFWQGKTAEFAFKEKGAQSLVAPVLKAGDFSGKAEEVFFLYPSKGREKRVLLLGLGEKKKATSEGIRRSYAQGFRLLHGKKSKNVRVFLPDLEEFFSPAVEGMLLANYSFDYHRAEKQTLVQKVFLEKVSSSDLVLCKKLQAIASSVYFARDLVMGNADDVTPTNLAKQAQGLSQTFPLVETEVFNRSRIEKEKLKLLLAVSQGSKTEPAFIILHYKGNPKSDDLTALIGKGITFDTGGLLLKPRGGMETMRDDMAGGAVVLSTIRAAAELKMPVNLLGIVASTENAIGPGSYKPGDVYGSHAGLSVEIADTDAEGRLVLADAISYAQTHYSLKRIIDLATLTGGAIVALGEEVAALCSNNQKLIDQLMEAGEKSFERLWPLPLYEEYAELLKSKIADIKNAGPRKASTICGAMFLKRFVKETIPWAHLDIAGVAFVDPPQKPYQPIQATGFGVRLLLTFLENLYGKGA